MFVHLQPNVVQRRRRWSQHVAAVIAASRERAEQTVVDAFDQRTQSTLHDSVKLKTLTRGHAQRVVRVSGRKIVASQILFRSHHTPGYPAAHHHDILLSSLAQVT